LSISAWKGYRDFAWGFDELKPISKGPEKNWFGLALTAIDALDTSLLMGAAEVTDQVRDWLKEGNPVYSHDGLSNVFEVTIRVLVCVSH
jgi:mannosyl-oligosaccharide alpha-1,2-mannosidase